MPPLVLNEGDVVFRANEYMSLTRVIEWLNEKFEKTSKEPFTAQDVYGYIKRGNLPYHFGSYKLEEHRYDDLGIRMIRVIDLNSRK